MNNGVWIHLCGGHASGKTTLLQSIREELPPDVQRWVWYVFADSGGAIPGIRGSGKVHDKYKSQKDIQYKAILDDWNSEVPVIVSDGTRIHLAIQNAYRHGTRRRKMHWVCLIQKPEVMEAHMRARCAKRGKAFREDFWTRKNLEEIGSQEWHRFFTRFKEKNPDLPLNLDLFEVDLEYSVLPRVRAVVRGLMREGKYLALEARDSIEVWP